jgi:hypothetical protein
MAFAKASRNAISTSLAFRNTAANPEQEHEFVHERRNCSQFAWQGALQSDVGIAVIVRYRHLALEIALL